MNQETKELNKLVTLILDAIKVSQDYSDDDMMLFKHIEIDSNQEKAPNKHFVRIQADEVYLDFICTNLYAYPKVEETAFEQWPIFSTDK